MGGTALCAAVGARSAQRVRHSLWHSHLSVAFTPKCGGHPNSLAHQQGYGGVVYANPQASGSTVVSFAGCNITGNSAQQVSMRHPIMSRYMQGSGSVQMNAMAPAGV